MDLSREWKSRRYYKFGPKLCRIIDKSNFERSVEDELFSVSYKPLSQRGASKKCNCCLSELHTEDSYTHNDSLEAIGYKNFSDPKSLVLCEWCFECPQLENHLTKHKYNLDDFDYSFFLERKDPIFPLIS